MAIMMAIKYALKYWLYPKIPTPQSDPISAIPVFDIYSMNRERIEFESRRNLKDFPVKLASATWSYI